MVAKPSLRDLISSDGPVRGIACTIPSAQIVEIYCSAGADYLFIDTEHTLIDRSTLVTMLQAAHIWQVPVIVRAAWNAPDLIGWPLDFGAQGIAVPMINTAEEARQLVHSARYPPDGHRSFGGASPAVFRSGGVFDAKTANEGVVCVAMIETREAFENIDEITSVEGLDAIFVGQSDLGVAYGLHPSRDRYDPAHQDRIRELAEVARRNGVASFIVCDSNEVYTDLSRMGYQCFMRSDVNLISEGARTTFSWEP